MLYKLFLLFCLYLPFQIALNPAEGIDLASGRVFILILALLWLIWGLKNRWIFVLAKIQTVLILSFLFISCLSLFWVENINWGVRKLLFLFSIFPVYFVTAGLLPAVNPSKVGESKLDSSTPPYSTQNDNFKHFKIVKFIVWGAGLVAMVGIIQFLLQFIVGLDAAVILWRNYVTPLFLGKSFSQAVNEYPSWLVNIGGRNYLRALSTFPDPHMFSFYLGLTLPLATGLYYALKKNVYLLIAAMIILADLLTFSRGGYAGLAAGLIFVISYFIFNKKISLKKIFVYFVLLLALFASLGVTPVGKRFFASFNISEGSNKERFENWSQAVKMIKNYPLGVGIGNYSFEIEPSAGYRKPIYAHNLYLDIAAETGLINAVIFIFILMLSIRAFVIKAKDNILYFGSATSLVIFTAHSIFDTALYSVQVLSLILIIAALSASDNYTLNRGR